MSKPKLHVVIASTRPQRAGLGIGRWFHGYAERSAKFELRLVDLAELALPLFDEPRHPRFGQYEHAHTKDWSGIVAEADAYVFVTPEYNYSAPPSLLNALDFVFREWHYKPCGFVSYGGVSGGTRAVQMLKQTVTALRMMPLPEGVTIPFFSQHVKDGVFQPPESFETAAGALLDELVRWAEALRALRQPAAAAQAR